MKRLAAILILISIAACTPYWVKDREARYAKCPNVELLAPARGWIDPVSDNWQVRGEISEYAVECKLTKTDAEVKVTATVQMQRAASFNPGAEANISLPLFISVTRGDEILSKQIINAPMVFDKIKMDLEKEIELPAALPLIKTNDPAPETTPPAPDDKDQAAKDKAAQEAKEAKAKDTGSAADRTVVIGFQLNPDQLDYFAKLRDANAAKLQPPAAKPQ